MKEDTNEKTSCVHGLEELILLKMSISLKAIYIFNMIPIKFPMTFFSGKKKLTFIQNLKGP